MKLKANSSKLTARLPDTPGVYIIKDGTGAILYVGKAGNLRRRVSSYFLRPHDARIQKLVSEIKKIEYEKTDTAIEALILESKLIKKYSPPFNVKEKDDKSFLSVLITNEKFPRVLLVRGKNTERNGFAPSLTQHSGNRSARKREERSAEFSAGPFTSASSIREAMRIIRRIFPWSTHATGQESRVKSQASRPCFNYEIGLCPGTCIGVVRHADYARNMRNIKLFFTGKKKQILRSLKKEMSMASKKLEFEKAQKIQRQIFALQHIQDVALISEDEFGTKSSQLKVKIFRIEGYDISNISGTDAVGSMVVFINDKPDKNSYRKFKIRTVRGSNDVGMLKEVLFRRLWHPEWPMPGLILVDGGIGQVNGFREVLRKMDVRIPVVGIAKGSERKRNDIIGKIPQGISENTLIRVRDEAHRFAIKYHKELRGRKFIN